MVDAKESICYYPPYRGIHEFLMYDSATTH